jgi:hypothetical protein
MISIFFLEQSNKNWNKDFGLRAWARRAQLYRPTARRKNKKEGPTYFLLLVLNVYISGG